MHDARHYLDKDLGLKSPVNAGHPRLLVGVFNDNS